MSSEIRKRIPEPEGVEILIADMTVAYKFVRETFTSRVTLDRPNLQILVEYLEGPFSRLENRWAFHATGERTCEVEFFISYEFRSRTLGLLMGTMFEVAFRRFPSPSSAGRMWSMRGNSNGLMLELVMPAVCSRGPSWLPAFGAYAEASSGALRRERVSRPQLAPGATL